jgi:DNA-binding CsgD family transcriptional regulator
MLPLDKQPKTAVMIATLGSEAQVVTAAFDLLTRRGYSIAEVWAAHTSGETANGDIIVASVERLHQAFAEPPYVGRALLRLILMTDEEGRPLTDVDTPHAMQAAFRCLYRLARQAKLDGRQVHWAIAGGRKPLSLFAMSAAQMLCDEDDRLWYLVSSGEFLASKRLHPQPDDMATLIEVPFLTWSRVSPIWLGLGETDDPFEALEQARHLRTLERLEAARSYLLGSLTAGERRVVELLARYGLSDAEIAERLTLSPRTVEQHLRAAYQKAANHWELEDVNRAQLVALVNVYYAIQENTDFSA